jgi:excisionase family DNA binding protein
MSSSESGVERVACSPKEAAEALGVCIATITNWIRAGHLPSQKIGGRRLIYMSAIDQFKRAA